MSSIKFVQLDPLNSLRIRGWKRARKICWIINNKPCALPDFAEFL